MPISAARTPSRVPAAATPMAFARAIHAVYEHYGQSIEAALREAQITPSQLRQPKGLFTARQMEVLSGTAMQELNDEALGAFGRPLPWGSYGMLARASITSPNLGVALKRWCRHHGLLTADVELTLGVTGKTATIAIDEKERNPLSRSTSAARREFNLVHLLRNVHGLACWYVDSRIGLAGASFPFAAPEHADAYAFMFPGGQLQFNAPRAEIRFDAEYLALPLKRDEKALRHMLRRALPLTVLQYRRDRLIVQQVRQALLANPGHGAESVGGLLHMSARTLHRQLKDEGASLQQLKDQVRCERAQELLYRSSKSVKQVAALVGFGNEKSFTRAFKAWTGRGPAAFRAGPN